jgi:hypothetical protein
MKGRIAIGLMLALGLILGVCLICDNLEGAAKQEVIAKRVKKAPANLDDPVWKEAQPVQIPFSGKERFAGKKLTVTTKAVYTDDSLYLLFKWPDPTLSVSRGTWKFDGQKWSHQEGNEDRFSLLFEINRIENFATKGCAVVCHVSPEAASAKGGRFGTKSEAEKGDLWHWKAARFDPVGFADDTWLTKISDTKGGRKADAGEGGEKLNVTEDKSKPLYMLAPGKKLGKHGILLAADAVKITDYTVFKAGDTITYQMPTAPSGSRADIKAVSNYAEGGWTLMLSRKLNTGYEDDVSFNPRKTYNFAMAVFDDSGDEDSYDSEVLTLKFGK